MCLEFRKACAGIIADPLFDTILEISASSCPKSDIARQEHLRKALCTLEKNIQEGLIQHLSHKEVTNENVPDDLHAEPKTGQSLSISHSMAVTEPSLNTLWDMGYGIWDMGYGIMPTMRDTINCKFGRFTKQSDFIVNISTVL